MGRLKRCHSELRVALAEEYEDNYRDINAFKIKTRNYLRDLEARDRLLIRDEHFQAEKLIYEREICDREHTEKLKAFNLEASALMA